MSACILKEGRNVMVNIVAKLLLLGLKNKATFHQSIYEKSSKLQILILQFLNLKFLPGLIDNDRGSNFAMLSMDEVSGAYLHFKQGNKIVPPSSVRGIKKLNKDLFDKTISTSAIIVPQSHVETAVRKLKQFLLKVPKLNPVRDHDAGNKALILTPESSEKLPVKLNELRELINFENILCDITLSYDNWTVDEILTSILPEDQERSASYSRMGHIIHLNLRDHLESYKYVIGEVLLSKVPGVSLVVNKVDTVDESDNIFRSFKMETIAGGGSTETLVRENGCSYSFDFSKVFWNPRLSTEHHRIVEKLFPGDTLIDVTAGVGPFVIPAAKKKCVCLANDLNPFSFKYLLNNCRLNKVTERVMCYNLDAKVFIQTVLKSFLEEDAGSSLTNKVHITMNLPAMAVNFLPLFVGLLKGSDANLDCITVTLHLYMFSHFVGKSEVLRFVGESMCLSDAKNILLDSVSEIFTVRAVSPNKYMVRISVILSPKILFYNESGAHCKKIKLQ